MSATAPEPRRPWFEKQPERRDWELAEFAARGLPGEDYVVNGTFGIKTTLPFRGEDIEIKVQYPFHYPDVPPTVFGPPILQRHQTRRAGNFCLLEDQQRDWWPAMSGAELVDEDLRWLLQDSEKGADAVAAGEADMPEPTSAHIGYARGKAMLLPDPFWPLTLPTTGGELTYVEIRADRSWIVAGIDGLDNPDTALIDRLASAKGQRHVATWVALTEEIPTWPTSDDLLEAGTSAEPKLLRRLQKALKKDSKRRETEGWVAITFVEEGPIRGERRRAWAFLRVNLTRGGKRRVVNIVRAQAITAAERARRVPELAGLAAAHVLVIGAGSLGAPVALELVKAGVAVTDVVDNDFYDVNNAVRHVLSTRYAGLDKEMGVAVDGENLNPFAKVRPWHLTVGGDAEDSALLDHLLRQTDVVVDTTGSQSVARVLQRRCREFSKPLVVAALTAGSHAGEVAIFAADSPCFFCFVLAQEDGDVPKPAEGPRSNVTPVGCSHPAFSGAGFDATAVAALAARAVVCATGKSSYPATDFDYVILNFRGSDPWRQGRLSTHPACPLCS